MRDHRRRRDSFHDESFLGRVGRAIRAPFRRAGEWVGRRVDSDSNRFGRQSDRSWRRLPGKVLESLIVAPVVFLITVWSSSREAVPFMLGLPAVFAALAAVAPGLAFNATQDQIRRAYDALSTRAITANDAKRAEIFSQKLFALNPENQEYYVRVASTIGQSKDDPEYALELIKQVAIDADVYSIFGHLWIARYLLAKSEVIGESDAQEVERHLQMVLKADPKHFDGHASALEFFVRTNQPERALEHAEMLNKSEPLTSHLLLKLLKDLGRDAEFEDTLNNVLLHISEVAYRQPNEFRLWQQLVVCCLLGKRYDEAFDYVETGLNLCTNPSVRLELNFLASSTLISWYDEQFTFTDKVQFQQSIRALNAALNLFIANGDALLRASKLYLDPSLDSKRMEWVLETLAADDYAYCTHLLIGWRALFRDAEGGVETARTHWQIAHTSGGMFTILLAQLSATIAGTEQDKIPLALQSVDLALTIAPGNIDLAEARGLILVYGERWFEARQQLVEVLPHTARKEIVLNKLIDCSQKLNDDVAVEEYKAQLQQLTNATASR